MTDKLEYIIVEDINTIVCSVCGKRAIKSARNIRYINDTTFELHSHGNLYLCGTHWNKLTNWLKKSNLPYRATLNDGTAKLGLKSLHSTSLMSPIIPHSKSVWKKETRNLKNEINASLINFSLAEDK